MRRLPAILKGTALILSHAMCALIAWQYCSLLWAGRYAGASAPAWTALLYAIPFGIAVAACLLAAYFLRKKNSSANRE